MTKHFDQTPVDDLDELVTGARGRFSGDQDDRREAAEPKAPARPSRRSGSTRRDGVPSRRQNGTTAESSKFTALLDQDDAAAFDELALELRKRLGRRVGKGDILRVLIRIALAPDGPDLVDALADRLADDGMT